jgi:hypothetical protein
MKICVVGWYFDGDCMTILEKVKNDYDLTIVSHRNGDGPSADYMNRFALVSISNIGLEFGAYDFYLKNIWDEKSSVLFMHDDMKISDKEVFKKIEKLPHDCAYIFRDYAEEKANGGKHGRAFFASARFLKFIKYFTCECGWINERDDPHNAGQRLPKIGKHTGFWYDPYNYGHVSGKPPIGVRHYNEGINHFHWMLGRVRDQRCGPQDIWPMPKVKMDVVNRVFFEEFIPGRRNCWKHIERERARYGVKVK